MIVDTASAIEVISGFDAGADGLASKSRELALGLLQHSGSPFSRDQFEPGHVTCTALVAHPSEPKVLMMYHHRLLRWLLPGGHVEADDASLAAAAAREAEEETRIRLDAGFKPILAGIDVHFIPAKRAEPYHLHHDLIWYFRAAAAAIEATHEAPEVMWAGEADYERLQVAASIRASIRRAGL